MDLLIEAIKLATAILTFAGGIVKFLSDTSEFRRNRKGR